MCELSFIFEDSGRHYQDALRMKRLARRFNQAALKGEMVFSCFDRLEIPMRHIPVSDLSSILTSPYGPNEPEVRGLMNAFCAKDLKNVFVFMERMAIPELSLTYSYYEPDFYYQREPYRLVGREASGDPIRDLCEALAQNPYTQKLKTLALHSDIESRSFSAHESLSGYFPSENNLEEFEFYSKNQFTEEQIDTLLKKLPALKRLHCPLVGSNFRQCALSVEVENFVRERYPELEVSM